MTETLSLGPETGSPPSRLLPIAGLLVAHLAGLVVVALLFEVISLQPVIAPDSVGYLRGAERLFDPSNWYDWTPWYIGYLAFLKCSSLLGSVAWVATTLQGIVVLSAALALVRIGQLMRSNLAGWLASLFYLLHPSASQWSRYLLTDSLYFAGIVLVVWLCLKLVDRAPLGWWPIALVALLTASLRPNGVIVPAAAATFMVLSCVRRGRWAVVGVIWVLTALALVLGEPSAGGIPLAQLVYEGQTVYGQEPTNLSMPDPGERDGLTGLATYALSEPFAVGRLFLIRIGWELVQVRPWYSLELNLFLGASMAGLYAAAGIGWWRHRGSALNRMIWCFTVPSLVVIGLTWAIYEGRFGWWFLPLVGIWAGLGVDHLLTLRRSRAQDPPHSEAQPGLKV